jgi:hypothetical protein
LETVETVALVFAAMLLALAIALVFRAQGGEVAYAFLAQAAALIQGALALNPNAPPQYALTEAAALVTQATLSVPTITQQLSGLAAALAALAASTGTWAAWLASGANPVVWMNNAAVRAVRSRFSGSPEQLAAATATAQQQAEQALAQAGATQQQAAEALAYAQQQVAEAQAIGQTLAQELPEGSKYNQDARDAGQRAINAVTQAQQQVAALAQAQQALAEAQARTAALEQQAAQAAQEAVRLWAEAEADPTNVAKAEAAVAALQHAAALEQQVADARRQQQQAAANVIPHARATADAMLQTALANLAAAEAEYNGLVAFGAKGEHIADAAETVAEARATVDAIRAAGDAAVAAAEAELRANQGRADAAQAEAAALQALATATQTGTADAWRQAQATQAAADAAKAQADGLDAQARQAAAVAQQTAQAGAGQASVTQQQAQEEAARGPAKKKKKKGACSWLTKLFAGIGKLIGGVVGWIGKTVVGIVKGIGQTIVNFVTNPLAALKQLFTLEGLLQTAANILLPGAGAVVGAIIGFAKGDVIGGITSALGAFAPGAWSTTGGQIMQRAVDTLFPVVNFAKAVVTDPLGIITKGVDSVVGGVGNALHAVGNIGQNIGAGLSGLGTLIRTGRNLVENPEAIGGQIVHGGVARVNADEVARRERAKAQEAAIRESAISALPSAETLLAGMNVGESMFNGVSFVFAPNSLGELSPWLDNGGMFQQFPGTLIAMAGADEPVGWTSIGINDVPTSLIASISGVNGPLLRLLEPLYNRIVIPAQQRNDGGLPTHVNVYVTVGAEGVITGRVGYGVSIKEWKDVFTPEELQNGTATQAELRRRLEAAGLTQPGAQYAGLPENSRLPLTLRIPIFNFYRIEQAGAVSRVGASAQVNLQTSDFPAFSRDVRTWQISGTGSGGAAGRVGGPTGAGAGAGSTVAYGLSASIKMPTSPNEYIQWFERGAGATGNDRLDLGTFGVSLFQSTRTNFNTIISTESIDPLTGYREYVSGDRVKPKIDQGTYDVSNYVLTAGISQGLFSINLGTAGGIDFQAGASLGLTYTQTEPINPNDIPRIAVRLRNMATSTYMGRPQALAFAHAGLVDDLNTSAAFRQEWVNGLQTPVYLPPSEAPTRSTPQPTPQPQFTSRPVPPGVVDAIPIYNTDVGSGAPRLVTAQPHRRLSNGSNVTYQYRVPVNDNVSVQQIKDSLSLLSPMVGRYGNSYRTQIVNGANGGLVREGGRTYFQFNVNVLSETTQQDYNNQQQFIERYRRNEMDFFTQQRVFEQRQRQFEAQQRQWEQQQREWEAEMERLRNQPVYTPPPTQPAPPPRTTPVTPPPTRPTPQPQPQPYPTPNPQPGPRPTPTNPSPQPQPQPQPGWEFDWENPWLPWNWPIWPIPGRDPLNVPATIPTTPQFNVAPFFLLPGQREYLERQMNPGGNPIES